MGSTAPPCQAGSKHHRSRRSQYRGGQQRPAPRFLSRHSRQVPCFKLCVFAFGRAHPEGAKVWWRHVFEPLQLPCTQARQRAGRGCAPQVKPHSGTACKPCQPCSACSARWLRSSPGTAPPPHSPTTHRPALTNNGPQLLLHLFYHPLGVLLQLLPARRATCRRPCSAKTRAARQCGLTPAPEPAWCSVALA